MNDKVLKIAKTVACASIVGMLLAGFGWRFYWFNYFLMHKIGSEIEQYDKGDNRTDND